MVMVFLLYVVALALAGDYEYGCCLVLHAEVMTKGLQIMPACYCVALLYVTSCFEVVISLFDYLL
jgi:hypothetical protein